MGTAGDGTQDVLLCVGLAEDEDFCLRAKLKQAGQGIQTTHAGQVEIE